jgi:hypothetical protein
MPTKLESAFIICFPEVIVGIAPDKESEITDDNEAIVRHAYHTAEGNVMDLQGFIASAASKSERSLSQVKGGAS